MRWCGGLARRSLWKDAWVSCKQQPLSWIKRGSGGDRPGLSCTRADVPQSETCEPGECPRLALPLTVLRCEPRTPFELDEQKFSRNLRSARRGVAAGPSGMTTEHLRPLLDDNRALHSFYRMCDMLARAAVPPSIVAFIRSGHLTAFTKTQRRSERDRRRPSRIRKAIGDCVPGTPDVVQQNPACARHSGWLLLVHCASARANHLLSHASGGCGGVREKTRCRIVAMFVRRVGH